MPSDDVVNELSTLVFDRIIRDAKINYGKNNQAYRFTRQIDGKTQGHVQDLTINIITPLHDEYDNLQNVTMRAMGLGELLVVLPADDRLFKELHLYKKTDRYIRHNTSASQNDATSLILASKAEQNRHRYTEIEERLGQLLGRAIQHVDASKLELGGSDPKTRIVQGFNELISRYYPNLGMLRDISFTEAEVARYVGMQDEGLLGNDENTLSEIEQEVLANVQSNQSQGLRTTVKVLVEYFNKRPYGWWDWATICIIAMLHARGKIEVRRDVEILEGDSLANALRNTQLHVQLVLEPQVEFSTSQLRNLKKFASDFFNTPFGATEARALGDEISEAMSALAVDLDAKRLLAESYPFLDQLREPLKLIRENAGQTYSHYFKNLESFENELLDAKEQIIDPIRSFINGDRRRIYDEAKNFLVEQRDNFDFMEKNDSQKLDQIISDSNCFKDDQMQDAKTLTDSLQKELSDQLTRERETAGKQLSNLREIIERQIDPQSITTEQAESLLRPFNTVSDRIANTQHIAVIREATQSFESNTNKNLLSQLASWLEADSRGQDDATHTGSDASESLIIKQLIVPFDKSWLNDEAEIERYLEALRKVLLEELESGKRLIV